MRDTILTAALTFGLLAGGTAAIGNELVRAKTAPAPVVTLPTVTVTGQRHADTRVVVLPTVTVTGRKAPATVLAAGSAATEPTRVQ